MTAAKVLIVDDEPEIINLIAAFLRRKGNYEVFFASSPQKALEIIKDNPSIDLVISDVEMPGMRGQDLLREIAQISRGTNFILISGYVHEPQSLPIDIPFIRKPFTANDLLSAVRQVLSLRSVSRPMGEL